MKFNIIMGIVVLGQLDTDLFDEPLKNTTVESIRRGKRVYVVEIVEEPDFVPLELYNDFIMPHD